MRLAEDVGRGGGQAATTGDGEGARGGVAAACWSPLQWFWRGKTCLVEAEQAPGLDAVVAELGEGARLGLRQLLFLEMRPPPGAAARSTRAKGECWCGEMHRKVLGMLQPVDGLGTTDPPLANVFLPLPREEESGFGTRSC